MKPILGYWYIRGIANPIRLLLHYVGVEFEDKMYTDPSEYYDKDLRNLSELLDFPNLPYYIDDEVKITQSKAILRHLGRKHNLDGSNEQELVRMDVIYEQVIEFFVALLSMAYLPDVENRKEIHEKLRKQFHAALPSKLLAITKFLGNDEWMGGKKLTYIDFIIYDVLDAIRRLFHPENLNAFPTLVAYVTRVEELKGVKEYLASDAFQPMPIFGPFALFGNTKDYTPSE